MPAPLAALAGGLARGGAMAGARGASAKVGSSSMSKNIMRSALSSGHGTSSSQFSPAQEPQQQGFSDVSDGGFTNNDQSNWGA